MNSFLKEGSRKCSIRCHEEKLQLIKLTVQVEMGCVQMTRDVQQLIAINWSEEKTTNESLQKGGCKQVEFFWSKGQRSNLLIELQGSNGMRSNFIVFVVWLGRFAPFAK